jgi:hypothetical protein
MDAQARIEKVLEQYKRGLLATDEARDEITGILFEYFVVKTVEFTPRDVMTLDSAINELRKHYDTLEGKEMSKLELYRVHTVLHTHLQEIGLNPNPIAIYTHPLEVQS